MYRKVAAVWVSLLIMVSSIVILVEIAERVEAPTTLYVGGGGGGNYSTIQGGINAAIPGDTVFVYIGTYYENLIVGKPINLIGEDRNNTIIDGNYNGDVLNITTDWVNVTGFTITHGEGGGFAGILIHSDNSSIIGNNIISNGDYGLSGEGNNNVFIDNNILFNYEGFVLEHSDFNLIQSNYLSNNTIGSIHFIHSEKNEFRMNEAKTYGISLTHSKYNDIIENHCNIGLSNSSENNIIGNNGTVGLNWDSHRNNIIGNNASNSMNGIYLRDSDENNIIGNIISSNAESGIYFYFSFRNKIINNTIYSNNEHGIYIDSGGRTEITGNIIASNLLWGIYLATVSGNITNNSIIFNENGIRTFLCSWINIRSNNISKNNVTGIRLYASSENQIINNIVMNNYNGVHLVDSPLFGSDDYNIIYHNSLINNTNQSYDEHYNYWDNGYPSGGNYWSDYNGSDNYKGPNQDIPGSDGIGDIERKINSLSKDNYPLMEPIDNYIILRNGWNLVSIPLIQADRNLNKVLELMDGSYDAVQWHDINDTNDPWKHHKIGKPYGNDLSILNETLSFWIHITQPGDTIFIYNGTQPTSNQTIQLHPGWNMVGYPSLTNHNRTVGLNNLTFDTHVDAIQWFDAATKSWHFMDQDDNFVPGRGYWVHSKVEAGWEVPL